MDSFHKPQLRATGIHHLTDARYFAAQEVQWAGFPLDSANEYYLDMVRYRAISEWIEGPVRVAEFSLATSDDIKNIAEQARLTAVQLGAFATAKDAESLQGLTVFKSFVAHAPDDVVDWQVACEPFGPYVMAMAFDFTKNNIGWPAIKGNPAVLQALQNLCNSYPVCLCLPDIAVHLQDVLETLTVFAIDLPGGPEEVPGMRNFDALNDFFDVWETLA